MSSTVESSFVFSFMHLELKRERKEDYMRVSKSKIGIGLQNK